MTALAAPRNTPQQDDNTVVSELQLPIAASTICHQGGMVGFAGPTQANPGYAVPPATGSALVTPQVVGVAEFEYDNSGNNPGGLHAGNGAAGAVVVQIKRGCFKFLNSTAGDLIGQANVFQPCWAADDQTVALTSGNTWTTAVHTGTGPAGTVTMTGTPLTTVETIRGLVGQPIFINIVIVLGGAVATATFQYAVNGGGMSATTTTAASVAIPNGLTINFAAGTYVLGDTYSFQYGARPIAGMVIQVDSDGVWVEILSQSPNMVTV